MVPETRSAHHLEDLHRGGHWTERLLARTVNSTPWRAACFATGFLFVDSLFYPDNQLGAADLFPTLWDKLVHFIAYGGLTGLLGFAAYLDKRVLIGCVVLAIGALDEIMQSVVPGRFADAGDFLADALGVMCAIWMIGRMRARIGIQTA